MSNKSKGFAQLAQLQVSTAAADLETPKETVVPVTSVEKVENTLIVNTVDQTGEDLGDVAQQDHGIPPTFEQSVEDEREHEDSSGLNDDVEDSIDDPEPVLTLNDRDVQTWTTEELEAYIAGKVDIDVFHSVVTKAITEYRIRETSLPQAWSLEECIQYFAVGAVPTKTSKGAWLKDATRFARREHEWTTQELESWATGEIEPEGMTLPAGLALELKQRLNLIVKSADVDSILNCYRHATGQVTQIAQNPAPTARIAPVSEAQIAEVKKQITYEGLNEMNQSYIESSLAEFAKVMAPGRAVNEVSGGDAQKLLRQVISYCISLPDPVASRSAMGLLLDYFRERRGDGQLFEDTYAFRFIENMRATEKEKEAHSSLLSLFLVYADPMVELRAQTDTASLIQGVPSQFQSRLFEFFGKL